MHGLLTAVTSAAFRRSFEPLIIGLIPASAVNAGPAPTYAEVQAWYQRNVARYSVPERRVIRYAVVSPDSVKAQATPTEAEIAAAYKENAARYAPTENVCASFAYSGCDTDAFAPSRKDQATCTPISRPQSSTCRCEEDEGDVADWVHGAYAKWPCANHAQALSSGLTSSSVPMMGMSIYARCLSAGIDSLGTRTSSDYGGYKSTMR